MERFGVDNNHLFTNYGMGNVQLHKFISNKPLPFLLAPFPKGCLILACCIVLKNQARCGKGYYAKNWIPLQAIKILGVYKQNIRYQGTVQKQLGQV